MSLIQDGINDDRKRSFSGFWRPISSCTDLESDFRVFRRFGLLHSRVLLHQQRKLMTLEQTLRDMDEEDSIGLQSKHSQKTSDAKLSERRLIQKILTTFPEYGKRCSGLTSFYDAESVS